PTRVPNVETLGYCRDVPPGQDEQVCSRDTTIAGQKPLENPRNPLLSRPPIHQPPPPLLSLTPIIPAAILRLLFDGNGLQAYTESAADSFPHEGRSGYSRTGTAKAMGRAPALRAHPGPTRRPRKTWSAGWT